VVLDFHTHPWLPRSLNPPTESFIRSISPAVAQHRERLEDPAFAADVLRAEGVDRAVVLPEHCPETSGNVRTEQVLAWAGAAPDLFLPFASVHPRLDPDPAAMLRGYIDRGARGLKLYPSYQLFYPDDEAHYPIYDVCQDAGIPLLLHVGSSVIPGTRLEFCHPRHLDAVARDFPDLPVVMAHGGRGHWYRECSDLVASRDNVHIDVTGLVPDRLLEHFPELRDRPDRFLFGSDWPAMPKSVAHNVKVVRGLGLSADALDRLLAGNAGRLLGIDTSAAVAGSDRAYPSGGSFT
jgi:predicted TIM-barrel fold metal-dependent hydrolase